MAQTTDRLNEGWNDVKPAEKARPELMAEIRRLLAARGREVRGGPSPWRCRPFDPG
ncbi:hypothetical protein [Phenylobacterium sp.]|uniref:hypothetical protein n=1 Tax=Phenylobacterium sp. TaxID=1871053 RepID=UPI0026179C09|nr:hypothetical protein [Phenylobacterium sp.]